VSSCSVYEQTLEFFNQTKHTSKIYSVNVENKPYAVASRKELIQSVGLDVDSIVNFVFSKI
ncbi:MAG: hypothetical protein K2K24_05290, partial [Clostridia bacterium]|nr:hypothetical protein [Clostridia bacterium]